MSSPLQAVSHQPAHGNIHQLWPDFMVGQVARPVRVLLIEDDAHMRRVIANELLRDSRTDLVAQAGSMREGRWLIKQHEFDVMLVDLNLGDGSGFDLIEHMKVIRPLAEAIVISAMEDEQHALRAFEMGATGYLIKNSLFGSLPQALLQVVNGGASISPNLARRLLQKFALPVVQNLPRPAIVKDKLTPREKDVLKMIAAGYTSSEIALQMGISPQTVNTHLRGIYRKLQVHSRVQAVRSAMSSGLL
ncbi:MAG: two component transcriptional regulator, LuxR family [Polaromonas sp.]|jgi:DNA-binding NarL/FixJ family response regulator|nr:two component transcriptional regulator, LuxR family [Polaromonas sp.]